MQQHWPIGSPFMPPLGMHDLVRDVMAMRSGNEVKEYGVDILHCWNEHTKKSSGRQKTLNITPKIRCSVAKLAAAMVRGVQSNHVGCHHQTLCR
ncbi:hypothetical protein P4S72_21915 [Vibrio sp. PP-XX7]